MEDDDTGESTMEGEEAIEKMVVAVPADIIVAGESKEKFVEIGERMEEAAGEEIDERIVLVGEEKGVDSRAAGEDEDGL